MASLTHKNGRHILQVIVGGKRRTIYLGRTSRKDANAIRSHVEHLANAADFRLPVHRETAAWAAECGDAMRAKLISAGLIQSSEPKEVELFGLYFVKYIDRRTDLKPRSITNLWQSLEYVPFDWRSRPLGMITRGEVKDWHRAMLKDFSKATAAMALKKCRQVFDDAIEHGITTDNPFKSVKAPTMANPERSQYVPASDVEKVIDACPTAEWRLVFALARYGGLRVPSETDQLRWVDIDFDRGRMLVHSPKTEHQGKGTRSVPASPRLMDLLVDAYRLADEGAKHVFVKLRSGNLRTHAHRIIERAGLAPWEKTFQNLRASCETDWATRYPLHVACAWAGNSTTVAMKHYLQIPDAFYESAAESAVESSGKDRKKPEHQTQNRPVLPSDSRNLIPPRGSEQGAETNENIQIYHRALQKALHAVNCYARHSARIRGEV